MQMPPSVVQTEGLMKLLPFTAAVAFCLGGCMGPQMVDRNDFISEGTRTYPGETRERVITAARTVLQASDPSDFEFHDGFTGFIGLRRFVIYAVIAASVGREHWDFQTEETPKAIRAAINVSEAGQTTGAYSVTPYDAKMGSVALYRLFWDRVDYMLGRRPDWVSCDQAEAAVKASGAGSIALGGLCGPTSGGRNAPAPTPLAPKSAKASM